MGKMSMEQFASKVEWEGGLYNAIVGYGLDETDLASDVDPEFVALVKEYAEKAKKLEVLEEQIEEFYN